LIALHPPLALAQAASLVADTVVTVTASSTGLQWWVDLITSIASIVIALALIVLAAFLVPAAWNSRKTYARINELVDRLRDDCDPIVRHAHAAADNVNYITASIRHDVEEFKGTIDNAQQRLNRAAETAEQRISEFNALLEVVQGEAEQLFIDTASTLRGVRAGASALQRPPQEEWEEEPHVAEHSPRRPRKG
jgi:biopolymer transport protein ExbB/TolQ